MDPAKGAPLRSSAPQREARPYSLASIFQEKGNRAGLHQSAVWHPQFLVMSCELREQDLLMTKRNSLGRLPTLHPKPGHLVLTSSSPAPTPHSPTFIHYLPSSSPFLPKKTANILSPCILLPSFCCHLPLYSFQIPTCLCLSLPSPLLLTDSPLII